MPSVSYLLASSAVTKAVSTLGDPTPKWMKRTDDRRVGVYSTYRDRLENKSECSSSANSKIQKELSVRLPFLGKFINESLQVLFCNRESKMRCGTSRSVN